MTQREEIIRDLVGQWLRKAAEDYAVSEFLLEEETVFLSVIAFHCQQAAEKYIKAVLVRHQVDFPKTHNLGELLDLIPKDEVGLSDTLAFATSLNPYAVVSRYPGDFPQLSRDEVDQVFSMAKQIREEIMARLKPYLDA